MSYCPSCRRQALDGGGFCWRCGHQLTSGAEGPTTTIPSSPLPSMPMIPEGTETKEKRKEHRQHASPQWSVPLLPERLAWAEVGTDHY
jgi:hypothetical protein